MPARGAAGLKMVSRKPLLVVKVFSNFSTGIAFWVPKLVLVWMQLMFRRSFWWLRATG